PLGPAPRSESASTAPSEPPPEPYCAGKAGARPSERASPAPSEPPPEPYCAGKAGARTQLLRQVLDDSRRRCVHCDPSLDVSEGVNESTPQVTGGGCRGERRSLPPTLTQPSRLRRRASAPPSRPAGLQRPGSAQST